MRSSTREDHNIPKLPKEIALAYLNSLQGSTNAEPRNYLLGGLTLTAEDFSISNWKIVKRDPAVIERGNLKATKKMMESIDEISEASLANFETNDGTESINVLSQEDAQRLLAPTKAQTAKFQKEFPIYAYVARAGKDVFWHPSNPWRLLQKRLGDSGDYQIGFHLFHIQENTPGKPPRVWPLRILRVRTDKYDSGWKILPASDWDPDF